MTPLIINLAVTGAVPTRRDSPHVPLTPEEIAADCVQCCQIGASIVHLHARGPDGAPTHRADVYAEIVWLIRSAVPDVIICVSTTGRHFTTLEQRSEALSLSADLTPDMGSLTVGSMNFPAQASINEPAMIKTLAMRMVERGIVPEIEVFDLGMVDYARYLIDRQILRPPFYFNVILGSLGTLQATPMNLALMVQALPPGATWGAAGIGRYQFPVNSLAITMGGHVRVGLEDNLYLDEDRTRLATNHELVERLVTLGRAAGRTIATPVQAREMLGLRR